MKLPRRQFLHLAAGTAALPAMSRVAMAQAYPTRPVRLIAPFAPGGATDLVARLMGQWLSERFGQQFIVENRPGAGGNIGTETVVHVPYRGAGPALIGMLGRQVDVMFATTAATVEYIKAGKLRASTRFRKSI